MPKILTYVYCLIFRLCNKAYVVHGHIEFITFLSSNSYNCTTSSFHFIEVISLNIRIEPDKYLLQLYFQSGGNPGKFSQKHA